MEIEIFKLYQSPLECLLPATVRTNSIADRSTNIVETPIIIT